MIIDFHCHFREENKPSKYYWDNLVIKTGVAFSGSPEEAVRERSRQSCDRTGDLQGRQKRSGHYYYQSEDCLERTLG